MKRVTIHHVQHKCPLRVGEKSHDCYTSDVIVAVMDGLNGVARCEMCLASHRMFWRLSEALSLWDSSGEAA